MPVTKTAQLFATTLCLLLGTTLYAQEAVVPADSPAADSAATQETAPAAADSLSLGREVDPTAPDAAASDQGIGSTYISAEHGDWQQRCVRTEDGADPCQLYQLLRDSANNAVAEISIFGLPAGQEAVAGATIVVPLETLLTEEMTMVVDGAKPRKYPFSWCSSIGCIARIGFTEAEVNSFRKGNKADISIIPVVAPTEKVTVNVSLNGFTAGYAAVNAANGN
jgi:invasion protein IalB